MLMNYDTMGLPWPDGYKEPSDRIQGLAPIGLAKNHFFFLECDILHELDFSSCERKQQKSGREGKYYNKILEPVAVRNHEILKGLPHGINMEICFEKLICAKHGNNAQDLLSIMEVLDAFSLLTKAAPMLNGYSLKILNEIDDSHTNFPQRFAICREGKSITLEEFFDSEQT